MSFVSTPPTAPSGPGDLTGVVLAERYRIAEPLNEGAMGSVFLGVDLQTQQEVAIKVMRAELAQSEEALSRFRREVRAVATLDSPRIVAAYDAGMVDGMPYLVMERLQGRGLDEVAAAGELTARQAVSVVIELLEGLEHAHGAGVIHRDLKPSNVWLTADGHTKILDFGVAKMEGAARAAGDETGKLTGTGAVLGSPAYMSPEQLVSSKEADERSDLWSVGVLLYELLTGAMIFKAETVGGIFANVIRMRIPALCEVLPGASPDLERVIAGCLVRDPEGRYASARAVADGLRSALEAEDRGVPLTRGGPVVPVTPGAEESLFGESPTLAIAGTSTQAAASREGAGRWWIAGVALVAFVGAAAILVTRAGPGVEAPTDGAPAEGTTGAAAAPAETSLPPEESPEQEPPAAAEADDPKDPKEEASASAPPAVAAVPPKPTADEPAADEPAADEPAADEPAADEPAPSASSPPPPPNDDLWETSRH